MTLRHSTGVSGEDVRREILNRIRGGSWQAGERLPSCRQIATELGSNANTVNRELQRLAQEGIVRSEPRRGTYVTGTDTVSLTSGTLRDDVEDLTRRAQAMGVSAADLIDLITSSYVAHQPSIAFVECNLTDLKQMTSLIINATGLHLYPVLIDDLDQSEGHADYDLIATPLFHFAEVLQKVGDDTKILELSIDASKATLRKIATLDPERLVSVAAPTAAGAERTAALVRTIFRGQVKEIVPTTGKAELHGPLDVLIYVNALELDEDDLSHARETIRIDWQLDGNSADALRSRVASLRVAT